MGQLDAPGPRMILAFCLRALSCGLVVHLGTTLLFATGVLVIFLRRIAILAILVVLLLRLSSLSIGCVSGVILLISVVQSSSAALLPALRVTSWII